MKSASFYQSTKVKFLVLSDKDVRRIRKALAKTKPRSLKLTKSYRGKFKRPKKKHKIDFITISPKYYTKQLVLQALLTLGNTLCLRL